MQPLLASVHNYAIWDDHDYGPNDADGSYANKKLSEEMFNNYWGNPNTDVVGNGGITGQFLWGDVEFFLLDNRYHRSPNRQKTPNKAYLGNKQLDWLIAALTASNAPFKFVCVGGQVINSASVQENYATYPEERELLLQRIHKERIQGVVFFSGDRHHTEISKMDRAAAYPLYDITCSSITSGSHKPNDELNDYREPETSFYQRNFGIVTISGKRTNRKLTVSIYDVTGNKIYDYSIKANDLRYSNKRQK
jgi:alkaline phosphatase D